MLRYQYWQYFVLSARNKMLVNKSIMATRKMLHVRFDTQDIKSTLNTNSSVWFEHTKDDQ